MFRIKFSECCTPWPWTSAEELFFQHPPDLIKLLDVMAKHNISVAITENNNLTTETVREATELLGRAQGADIIGHDFKDSMFINHGMGWQMTVESIHVD
jgi:hypothetical protein